MKSEWVSGFTLEYASGFTGIRKRIQIAGIGELIENEHLVRGVADEQTNNSRPDESGPTCYNILFCH